MKRRRTIFLTILALLLAIPVVWTLWPEGRLDLSKDEEPFRSMVLPPKVVYGLSGMDGGSLAMRIWDKAGGEYIIGFQYEDRIVNAYPTAFFMNVSNGSPEKPKPLRNPARAKEIVTRILRDYGNEMDGGDMTEKTLHTLSQPVRQIPSRLIKRVMSYL